MPNDTTTPADPRIERKLARLRLLAPLGVLGGLVLSRTSSSAHGWLGLAGRAVVVLFVAGLVGMITLGLARQRRILKPYREVAGSWAQPYAVDADDILALGLSRVRPRAQTLGALGILILDPHGLTYRSMYDHFSPLTVTTDQIACVTASSLRLGRFRRQPVLTLTFQPPLVTVEQQPMARLDFIGLGIRTGAVSRALATAPPWFTKKSEPTRVEGRTDE